MEKNAKKMSTGVHFEKDSEKDCCILTFDRPFN